MSLSNRRRSSGFRAAVALGALAVAAQALAQGETGNYPTRPIKIIVPTAAGGGNDFMGRYIALKLGEALGRQIVVENRPGAAGMIGSELTANAAPDGYTLLMASTAFSMVAAIRKMPFDPIESFSPVSLVSASPSAISVHPSLPVKSISDLIGFARKRPGELRYASAGIGSFNHFSGELFKLATDVDIVHVPYKGGPPGIIDAIAGHVEVLSSTLPAALPHLRAGKLRGLGVGSRKRSPALPSLPSISETVKDYESVIWWGLLAPANTPGDRVTLLNRRITAILGSPEAQAYLAKQAAQPLVATPAQFRDMIVADLDKWARVARARGLTGK